MVVLDAVGVELAAVLDDADEDAGFELEAEAEDAGASLHPAIVTDKLMASAAARIRADFLLNRMINTSHIFYYKEEQKNAGHTV